MLVEMPTDHKAAKVAEVTGWALVPSKADPEKPSRRLGAADGFEEHRAAVEAVSVLFKLYDTAADGSLAQVPSGWTVTAAKFEVEWPEDPSVVRSHFGARRFAYNWARGRVIADIETMGHDPGHEPVAWNLAALRKEWNRLKDQVAPWWAENSKEAYSSGIADLVQALSNWRASRSGTRKGPKVGFPKAKSRRKDHGRVRFGTGTMRIEADRGTITVPVIGALRSKENTRRLQRPLAQGRARILTMTVSQRWGRLFVAVNYATRTPTRRPEAKPGVRAGVDLGLRSLASVADTEGNIIEFANPAPLRATVLERRRAGRQLSRRIPGSRGYEQAITKLARLDRRAVNLRREAWHQLTSWLAATYSEVVVEDLDIAALKRSMGRRAFRRSVTDAALGQFRPLVTYKAMRAGTVLIPADRWYPSSQIHHGCGCRLTAPSRLAKHLICTKGAKLVDRDINAALNLRDWPDHASCGPVGTTAPSAPGPTPAVGTGHGSDVGSTRRRRSDRKTVSQPAGASRGEARTQTPRGDAA